MAGRGSSKALNINMLGERNLSVIVQSLFSSWLLAFLFEGQILLSLANACNWFPNVMIFGGVIGHFAGLFLCGSLIKTKKAARQLFLCSYIFFIIVSAAFFFSPSVFWVSGVIASSFLSGGCVAAWGFYLKSGTPQNERIKTIADLLILSNVLMILLNVAAFYFSPHLGLALSMLMLAGAFLLALRLPVDEDVTASAVSRQRESPVNILGPLALLYLFILVITINSGLMYHVVNPAFAHLEKLTSWYWAVPYIIALFIMRNLPRKTNRTYILYVAIAMIGLSFIGFMALDRTAPSYLIVNTLMLGACGVYDLFWWSILGGMLEFHRNSAQVLGIGLSANVLGVLLGGLAGGIIITKDVQSPNTTLLAMAVVCITLAVLPLLHRQLASLLADHVYLKGFYEMPPAGQKKLADQLIKITKLTERENQVALLLLEGKTYKVIAGELFISENTVKYYVKNIYAKLGVKNRTELINILWDKTPPTM